MKKNKPVGIYYGQAVFITTLLLLTTFTAIGTIDDSIAHESTITQLYTFDVPSINQVTINEEIFDQIQISNAPSCGQPGEPLLPALGISLLLPQGMEITKIDVVPGQRMFLGSGFRIEPVREPRKISEPPVDNSILIDDIIYSSSDLFPESLFTEVGVYSFRGYEILIALLNPVQYIPASGDLFYFTDMTVRVRLRDSGEIHPLYRGLEQDARNVGEKVDNPEVLETYEGTIPLSSSNYDLLILTTGDFQDDFLPLKNFHDANGITTEIKILEEIPLHLDDPSTEDIRGFITQEYLTNGLEYVLIGGDDDIVPAKGLWVQSWNGGDQTVMPSDLYYSCLDGPFDGNGNDLWGEPEDGLDGGDVDLIAEVYIGRACIGSSTEVNRFVSKTLEYIDSGGYADGAALMVGEHLWSDPDTWGGDYMDELIDGSSAHGYTTVGLPSSVYDIDTLYDRDWPGHSWPKSEVITRINNGARLINHLGHSSYDYNMKLDNSDVSSLNNEDPIFVYSQGCMAGGFDNGDCIAEYFTVKTDDAAFAVIMNARYGWGVVGSTDGPSQRFHREFLDAIYSEGIPELGKANQDSREDNLYRIGHSCMRWCYYQLNLFGDPTLTFISDANTPPETPIKPSGNLQGKINVDILFTSSASDVDGDDLYYKWSWGDGTYSDWLGPYSSGEDVTASHNWSKRGSYDIKVKVRDEHRDESDWSEPLSISIKGFSFLQWLLDLIQAIFNLF